MSPLQRTLYRIGLALAIVAGAAGSIVLIVGGTEPAGIRIESPPEAASTAPTPGVVSAPHDAQLLDLNAASRAELDSLPRIGEVLADRIVQYRNENGPFLRVDHIMAVRGIGPTTYEALRDYVTVAGQ